MSSPLGLPQTPEQRPPLRRGVKELLVAVAALPVLLVAGIYVGGHLSGSGSASLQPAAGAVSTPAPLVTVRPSPPRPLVTVKPAAPAPVVTVKPAAPRPVVTVTPAAPRPVVTVRPHGPTTAAPPSISPPAQPPAVRAQVAGPVAPTTPPAVPVTVLARGSTGADVRAWQRQMARRHWRITVDGIFGPETERVARDFQRIKGLRVDGVVGRETWDAAWRRPVLL